MLSVLHKQASMFWRCNQYDAVIWILIKLQPTPTPKSHPRSPGKKHIQISHHIHLSPYTHKVKFKVAIRFEVSSSKSNVKFTLIQISTSINQVHKNDVGSQYHRMDTIFAPFNHIRPCCSCSSDAKLFKHRRIHMHMISIHSIPSLASCFSERLVLFPLLS